MWTILLFVAAFLTANPTNNKSIFDEPVQWGRIAMTIALIIAGVIAYYIEEKYDD